MKHELSVLFSLRKSKIDKKGLAPIYLRITVDGERAEISVNRKIEPKKWDNRLQRVVGRSELARTLNDYLDSVETQVKKNFNILLDKQKEISASILRDMQTGKYIKDHTLISVFETNNKLVEQEEGSKYSRSTIDQYTTTLNRLKAFLKKEYKCNDRYYMLAGLSFREYLQFSYNVSFDSVTIDYIFTNHRNLSRTVSEKLRPLPAFRKYTEVGYLPIFIEGEDSYLLKLNQIINTIVDTGLAYIAAYNSGTANKVKKLLGVIAESVPFKPNIAALSRKLDISRDSIYQYMYQLKDARLLNTLSSEGKGVSTLQKPDKVYLENTNLAYALKSKTDIGNIRETFVFNQLHNAGHEVFLSKAGDFVFDGHILEIGAKNKTTTQVKHIDNYLIAADNIETGAGNKAPIWLFGFSAKTASLNCKKLIRLNLTKPLV